MEFALGFFFGMSWWFWVICLLEFSLLIWFVECELGIASLVSFGVTLVLLWWLADIPIWTWIRDNPGQLAMYALYYVLVGLGWSVGKYYFMLARLRREVKKVRSKWLSVPRPSEDQTTWEEFRNREIRGWKSEYEFENTAKKLVFWSAWWPPSMFWTLLNDPISWFFKFLVRDVFVGMYKSMYWHMVGKHMEEPSK
jgi:hypothetical protein